MDRLMAARPRLGLLLLVATALIAPPGCGYTLRSPYSTNVRTIYVPMFGSTRFRRDINIQLTQLLVDEINARTPYRVVSDPDRADARLEGVVKFDDKNVQVENPFNLPRHLVATMSVDVTYTDNRAKRARNVVIPAANVNESAFFDPELGESTTAAFEKVMRKIARDIVNMMEEPWGDEYDLRDAGRAELEAKRIADDILDDEPIR